MFDQLVESKSNADVNKRRSGFLLTTMIIVSSLFIGVLIYSLFSKEITGGNEDLELTSLVAPVPLPENEPPPPPEPEKKTTEKPQDVTIRKELIARIEQTTEPPKDTRGQQNVRAIPEFGKVKQGSEDSDARVVSREPTRIEGTGEGVGRPSATIVKEAKDDEPPPTVKKAPPRKVSGGVLNGKAISLPKPPYPAAARAVHASGAVNVQVTIDVNGNVISASAVSGHPLLQQVAVQAARSAKFSPTILSGQPVVVTGVIVYNFVAP
jgi:protein TonB